MRRIKNALLRLVRGNKKPMPWEHGLKFQKEQQKKVEPPKEWQKLPRDDKGRWIYPDN